MMIAAQRKGHAMGSYFHVIERKGLMTRAYENTCVRHLNY